MKALQPKGIRIRPSETAVGRIGKPMRSGKCRSKLPNRFKQRQKTKLRYQNTSCSAATLNRQREKRQFARRPTSHRGKHRCYRPLPCGTSTETNKRPSENIFQTAFPNIKEAKGSIVHRRRVRKDRERCRAALLLYEPAFGLTKSLNGELDSFYDSEIFYLAVHKNEPHGLVLHPFDCAAVGGSIAAAARIADGTVGLNGETHSNFAVGSVCVLEEAHFGSSRLSGKEADDQQSGG